MAAVAVLGSATNATNVALVKCWQELGLDAALVTELDLERPGARYGVVLGRLDVLPTLDGVEPGLLPLFGCECRGVPVLNRASALAAAHDKRASAWILRRAGLPHPRTETVRAGEPVPLPLPFVLKPRLGSWGRDVFRCRDLVELERALAIVRDRPWFHRHGALVQELLTSPGYDLRLVVAGGRVVAAGERVAAPGDWRTNVSLGGSLRRCDPPAEAVSLAIAAGSAIGADLVGVDLMPVGSEFVVLELNGAVDFDQRYSLDGTNVYAETGRAFGLLS
jgi:RimK family alpha-L-glutamate ligase